MRLLLDTHTLLWAFNGSSSLSTRARRLLEDGANEILVSAVSAWEIATKVRLGKLATGEDLISDFSFYLAQVGVDSLPISIENALRAGGLPGGHREPFDRMLVAQGQAEGNPLLSHDR